MTFDEFSKNNNKRMTSCNCCYFCRHFQSDPYDIGGKCVHPDITGDEERYWASVYDFEICNKFNKVSA